MRNVAKAGIAATYMNDMGRQRITKYVSKKYEKSSKMSKQFNKEVHKIKELSKKITSKRKENLKNKTSSQAENEKHLAILTIHDRQVKNPQTSKKSSSGHHIDKIDDIDAPIIDKDKILDEEKDKRDENCARKETELKNLFYVVNRILHKYRLSKIRSKYRCTTSKSLLMKRKYFDINVKKKKKEKFNNFNTSLQQIINDAKATSFYNSIKTNLITQKPIRTGKGINEVFGFMEIVQNTEKRNSNITYRFV